MGVERRGGEGKGRQNNLCPRASETLALSLLVRSRAGALEYWFAMGPQFKVTPPPKSPKVGSETLICCFMNKTDIRDKVAQECVFYLLTKV